MANPFRNMRYLTVCLCVASVSLSCNSNSTTSSPTISTDSVKVPSDKEVVNTTQLIIDIKLLSGKTLSEIENILGKAEKIEIVKGYPCINEICRRAYFSDDRYEIIFKKLKTDWITINDVPNLTNDDQAILMLGITARNPTFKNPGNVIRWNDVEGIHEITFFTDYILIKVNEPDHE